MRTYTIVVRAASNDNAAQVSDQVRRALDLGTVLRVGSIRVEPDKGKSHVVVNVGSKVS